jgi:hypothetical protein
MYMKHTEVYSSVHVAQNSHGCRVAKKTLVGAMKSDVRRTGERVVGPGSLA